LNFGNKEDKFCR